MYDLMKAFVWLNVADQGTTAYGLSRGGREGNPVFRFLFEAVGFQVATVIKLVLAVTLCALVAEAAQRWPRTERAMRAGLAALCLVYVVAVTSNVLGGL